MSDHTSTRVLSNEFEIEGVQFSWWAVEESPALVTVSNDWCGSKWRFSDLEPEVVAKQLARELLRKYYDRRGECS